MELQGKNGFVFFVSLWCINLLTVLDFVQSFVGIIWIIEKLLKKSKQSHKWDHTDCKEKPHSLLKPDRVLWMLDVFAFESNIAKTWGRKYLVTTAAWTLQPINISILKTPLNAPAHYDQTAVSDTAMVAVHKVLCHKKRVALRNPKDGTNHIISISQSDTHKSLLPFP